MNHETPSARPDKMHFNAPVKELTRDIAALPLKFLDMDVSGLEHLPVLQTRGVVFAWYPHTSHMDAMAIRRALPRTFRGKLIALTAADYWHNSGPSGRMKSSFASLFVQSLPMTRDIARMHDLNQNIGDAVSLLQDGYFLLISPEGTRDGAGILKSGVAEIAWKGKADIVPVMLTGFDRVMPKGRLIPDLFGESGPKKVSVSFGEPIHVTGESVPLGKIPAKRFIMARLAQSFGVTEET